MSKYYVKAASRAQVARRRVWAQLGTCCAVLVTVLPLGLMLFGLARPCPAILPDIKPSWLQRVNPFSLYNLCHVKQDISNTHQATMPKQHLHATSPGAQSRQGHSTSDTQQATAQAVQQRRQEEADALAATAAAHAAADAARKQQEAEEKARQEAARAAAEEKARTEAAQQASREAAEQQKAQEAEQARLRAAAEQARAAAEAGRGGAPAGGSHTGAPGGSTASSSAAASSSSASAAAAGSVDDEVELPRSEEDVERILAFPHYNECNLCKVCVPLDVVRHHPKARAHPAVTLVRAVATEDEDVTVEVPPNDNAGDQVDGGSSGQRQRRSLLAGPGALLPGLDRANTLLLPGLQAGGAAGGVGGLPGAGQGAPGPSRRVLGGGEPEPDETRGESDGFYRIRGKDINITNIAPGPTKAGPRAHLPNCTVCWGCDHTLELMASGTVMAGSHYAHEPGGSPSWLFRVRSPRARSGWAVVKAWCVPVRKAKQRGLAMCSPRKVYSQVKLLLAQQKVAHECGLNSVVPSVWVEPVRGVIPGHGFRVDWLGLWADIADGLSVQNVQEYGNPHTSPQFLLELLTTRVNHTALQLVALFDVLLSQCDRHQQNLFITESGDVWAIDNDQVSGIAWRQCGFDSLVLPTTQKFMINHLGYFYVMKFPQKDPPKVPVNSTHNPLLLLDYRCHVEGRAIGFNYPPALNACLRHLSSLTGAQVQAQYGFPTLRMAATLRNRSADLLSHGFEWTLLHGQPSNLPAHRYKLAPPCCSMAHQKDKFVCTEPGWFQAKDLPFGNPWHGGPWHGPPGLDTGTYEGGTVF